ncbi:hypothetical protein [Serratia sp. Tan611]|uniref:hypothetical protein n=1 Tax=Serratia sp. Tan611 TaxID=2773264 RepID=UPI001AFB3DD1|nr:conserved membrane protein of unknown function [Serratia sp. Tan611]
MTTQPAKIKNIYFYLFLILPLIVPIAYYFTSNDKIAYAIFYIASITCVFFDQKEMVKSTHESQSQFIGSALGIIIFPPIYAFGRAKAAGMMQWLWLAVYVLIALGSVYISITIDKRESIKIAACEITTSIFKDKSNDTKCIIVKDLETVSAKYYRAKAVLTNGVDMPITIEERDDDYLYVTLTPLSNLLD